MDDFRSEEATALRELVKTLAKAVLAHEAATIHSRNCPQCHASDGVCVEWSMICGHLMGAQETALISLSRHPDLMALSPTKEKKNEQAGNPRLPHGAIGEGG